MNLLTTIKHISSSSSSSMSYQQRHSLKRHPWYRWPPDRKSSAVIIIYIIRTTCNNRLRPTLYRLVRHQHQINTCLTYNTNKQLPLLKQKMNVWPQYEQFVHHWKKHRKVRLLHSNNQILMFTHQHQDWRDQQLHRHRRPP